MLSNSKMGLESVFFKYLVDFLQILDQFGLQNGLGKLSSSSSAVLRDANCRLKTDLGRLAYIWTSYFSEFSCKILLGTILDGITCNMNANSYVQKNNAFNGNTMLVLLSESLSLKKYHSNIAFRHSVSNKLACIVRSGQFGRDHAQILQQRFISQTRRGGGTAPQGGFN